MANDQYKIPTSIYAEPEVLVERVENTLVPEHEATPYEHVKEIEATIFSYREAAQALDKPQRYQWIRSLVSFALPKHHTITELIEQESQIGGALFGPGQRFWLDAKSSNTVYQNNITDWYHLQPNSANPKEEIVLRFQVTPYSIHKLYDGREYELTIQDLERFVDAVDAYKDAVLPLYPLDQAIQELKDDDRSSYDLAA